MEVFALDPALDARQLAPVFKTYNRIHIPGFLTNNSAQRLHHYMVQNENWHLLFNVNDLTYDLTRAQFNDVAPDKRQSLMQGVEVRARDKFQYLFESMKVPDDMAERLKQKSLLTDFHSFLNSPLVFDFLRTVTGDAEVCYADAQATAYSAGHFLTRHDDNVAGKHRRVAYVLNLTPEWNPDWGGLLQFFDADGHISEAYAPKFNALNLFVVPQAHSVSFVAPFVSKKRLSITGWLRTQVAMT